MKENYFTLHIGPDMSRMHETHNAGHLEQLHKNPPAKHDDLSAKHTNPSAKSGDKHEIKIILKNGLKQFVVTILILIIGFFAINYQAYYAIIKNQIDKFFGIQSGQELTDIVQNNKIIEQKLVSTDKTLVKQIQEVPKLEMAITPPDMRLIIPRINQNIPIVRVPSENLIKRDWGALEKDMQDSLKGGVVHYPGTSMPDQTGNTVITGHSSYFPWDPGRFKDVFALLHEVVLGDKIAIYYNQHKYVYQVSEIKVVMPSDIDVLKQTTDQRITLITCTPIGTNLKRLVVIGTLLEEGS